MSWVPLAAGTLGRHKESIPSKPEVRQGKGSKEFNPEINFLGIKVRAIGEYLIVSEPGELIGEDHCEYHNIGETLYSIGQKTVGLTG